MYRKYSFPIDAVTNTATKILQSLCGTASVRPMIYDFLIGSHATPAEQAAQYSFLRTTATGTTATALVVPQALDPGDPACSSVAAQGTYATDPTTTGVALLNIALNQRATQRWVCAPGSEIVLAASVSNGVGLKAVAGTAAYTVDTTVMFQE